MKPTIRHIILSLLCLTAVSVPAQEHQVVVQASECAAPQTYSIPDGASLILTATASDNSNFTQWSDGNTDNPRTVTVTGDVSFTALFASDEENPSSDKYTATIYAGDCTAPFVGEFAKGALLQIVAEPKEGCRFRQWSDGNTDNPRALVISSDIELRAEFEESVSHETLYSVTVDADGCGNPFSRKFYGGTRLVLQADPKEGHIFSRWSDGNTDNPRNVTVTSDIAYTAEFTPKSYTVTFLNEDGTVLDSRLWDYGTTPTCTEPSKPADAQYTYVFAGWDKEVVAVTGDATYIAVFESVVQCGTIKTTDGTTVWEDELPYTWESVTFNEAGTETLMLQASDGCDSVVTFTLRVRYHNIVLQENEDAQYYDFFAEDYNGYTVTTATLNRQFTQSKWATLCLPFNVNKAMMMSLGLYNRVFAFRYAQRLDDETIQVFFVPAQSIEAGKGYIVNPNAKLAAKTSFVFPNVTIDTDSDNGDITALTGYNDGTGRGNLYLVGTLRTGILQGTTAGNSYLGLKDNQLYYPNTTAGTSIRAYRGFFRSDIPVNASRVRIIADGEPVSELEVTVDEQGRMDNGQLQNNATPARKYIENGILYIRSNGVTYTAQGQRLD